MKYYNPYDIAITLKVSNGEGKSYTIKPMPRCKFELLEGYSITEGSCAQFPNVTILQEIKTASLPLTENVKEKGNK